MPVLNEFSGVRTATLEARLRKLEKQMQRRQAEIARLCAPPSKQ